MKVEFEIDKLIIYLYEDELDVDNINILGNTIKNIITKLIKKYHMNFGGYYKVSIYNNKKYGNILELENLYTDCNTNNIDLKILVYKDTPMYLEFDNLYFDWLINKAKVENAKYYININDLDNIMKYIEYGILKYK